MEMLNYITKFFRYSTYIVQQYTWYVYKNIKYKYLIISRERI